MRTNPHILEVNTQVWINQIRQQLNRDITLADIPESYLFKIKALGFDAVWLMGIWQQSPTSAAIAKEHSDVNTYLAKTVPDYKKEDITASLYAIYDYVVNPNFGGNNAIRILKQRLNEMGIKLILDFAGNHLSCDNPYILTNPEMFITKTEVSEKEKELFFQAPNGLWFAHGKDPHFYPWTDTAQLNFASPVTRAFLTKTLDQIALLCDGLRCDMVMLMLNKVFQEQWGQYISKPPPQEEFWTEAIRQIKEKYSTFTFLAEVYWGLDWEVQELGFDFTYDKTLYDRLLMSNAQDIQGHLNAEHLYQMRSLRFIANHDEESPIRAFGKEKSKAAATACYTLTGARLFTMSQLYGAKYRLPIQYLPQKIEKDNEFLSFYNTLLEIINHPCFHGGQWSLKHPLPVAKNDEGFKNILSWLWVQNTTCKIVVINYSDVPSKCKFNMDKLPKTDKKSIILTEQLKNTELILDMSDIRQNGFYQDMKPYEVKIFSYNF